MRLEKLGKIRSRPTPNTNDANQLGTYLRNLRLDHRRTLADVSRETLCSVGYLSRIELGQVPDGPSVELLQRLANFYASDAMLLVRLADHDRKQRELASPTDRSLEPGNEASRARARELGGETDSLREDLDKLAKLNDYVESVQEAISWLPATAQIPQGAHGSLLDVARYFEDIGEQCLATGQPDMSLAAYKCAEGISASLGRATDQAVTQFRIARVYRTINYSDKPLSQRDCLEMLYQADRHFESAHRLFTTNWDDLTTEQRSMAAESLTDWGKADINISEHSFRLVRDIQALFTKRGDSSKNDLQQGIEHSRLELAKIKRLRAASIFEELINQLEADANHHSGSDQEAIRRLCALTYHRIGHLYSDLAFNERDRAKHEEYDAMFTLFYTKSLMLNRELAISSSDLAQRKRYVKEIIHTHLTFGWSLQIGRDDPEGAEYFAKALWQYSVGEQLLALYPPNEEQGFREDAVMKLNALTSDKPTLKVSRRRVLDRLRKNNYGTLNSLVLDYEPTWD